MLYEDVDEFGDVAVIPPDLLANGVRHPEFLVVFVVYLIAALVYLIALRIKQ